VRQLAAAALGAIERVDALPALADLLEDDRDPRVQVSAARAILEIIEANRAETLPFASAVLRRRQ
jgi:HEAT repeat protein